MSDHVQSGNRLAGKIAFITGATGGIGEATAKLFLAQGAKVMLVARSQDKLDATIQNLGASENLAHCIADAADEKAIAQAVEATVATFGGLDVLFANAGTEGKIMSIEDQTYENFEQVLHTNVIGVWLAMKYCGRVMRAQGSGSMIATASTAGAVGFPGLSPYIASKHAVNGLVKTAALEFGEAGIRVNAVAPGPIANRMMQSLEEQLAPDDVQGMHDTVAALIPMKRYGTNEEVAQMTLFLASDESSFCNGATYMVDGGFIAA